MERRSTTWGSAIRLALALSVAAAAVAWILAEVGAVSETAIVLTVIVIGFVASWVRTGQVARAATAEVDTRHAHRIVTVPLHGMRVG